jgi:hypothetical protein
MNLVGKMLLAGLVGCSLAGSMNLASAAVAHDEPKSLSAAFKPLLEKESASVVTVKYTVKVGEQSQEQEVPGVVIDSKGLVLLSNMMMGGFMLRFNPSTEFDQIKVITPEDPEGVEAKVIARDSELDLAWVQVKEPKKDYQFIDFSKGATPEPGDQLLGLMRMGKFFDRSPVVSVAHMLGVTKKPRHLYVADSEMPGTAVFSMDGKPVGVSVLQIPSEEDMEGGGMDQAMRDPFAQRMILPASEIIAATVKAREAAAAAPAEEPKPAGEPAPAVEGEKK